MPPEPSMLTFRIASLSSGGISFRWQRAKLAQRRRVDQPTVGAPARYNWQDRVRASRCHLDRAEVDKSTVVAPPPRSRRRPHSAATTQVQCSRPSSSCHRAVPPSRPAARGCRVKAWDAALARAALGSDYDKGGPLVERAAELLSRGRRPATKRSYVGKWRRFVRFCTHTLPQVYKWRARRYLPATESTVILYLCHLRDEGQVHESSLNPYMAAINQTHEDLGFPRPALGHYTSLLRKGFRDAEGDDFDADHERASRAPVPADVIYAILQLGLKTSEPAVLRMCACIVLCYCWYNRADTGMLVLRRDVTIDDFGITINQQGKTIARNQACPVHHRPDARFDRQQEVLRLIRRWDQHSADYQAPTDHYWSLQGEDQQAKRWPASLVTKWLNRLLPLVKCSPPAGEKWTGHSLRSGGACASLAIGVGFFHIQQYGVWKSITSVQRYLSLFTLASRAAYIFFGWMLPAPPPPA